jgi:Uri superfamily endonuclease
MSPQGTYALLLHLEASRTIAVGARGALDFPSGWYLYVGSARGRGGLAARLARHRRLTGKRLHWHIDYVRAVTRLVQVWTSVGESRRECDWAAAAAALPGASVIAYGLGASDCNCPSHLLHFSGRPELPEFASLIDTQIIREYIDEPGIGVR